jgi:hypothetical protein
MSGAHLEIEGGRALRASLKQAGDDMEDLKDVYGAVATLVAWRGVSLAPRRSGTLSMTVRPNRAAARAQVIAGSKRVPYAPPIHWGWHRRHIEPSLFLTRAGKQTEPEWTDMFSRGIQDILDRVEGA